MRGLDLDNEFVKAVHEYHAGREPIERSIALLEQHERKHDLILVAPGLYYNVRPGVMEVTDDPRFDHLVDPENQLLDELFERHLYPFLSDSHAVLMPSYPDDSDVVFGGRYFYHGTARAVAATYAEWARRERWLGRSRWHYTDLYYSQSLPKDVYRWVQSLYDVVTEKCRRSLEKPA